MTCLLESWLNRLCAAQNDDSWVSSVVWSEQTLKARYKEKEGRRLIICAFVALFPCDYVVAHISDESWEIQSLNPIIEMKSSGVIKLNIRTLAIGFRPTELVHIDGIGTGIKWVHLTSSITMWLVMSTTCAYRELLRGGEALFGAFLLVRTSLLLCILDHEEVCSD